MNRLASVVAQLSAMSRLPVEGRLARPMVADHELAGLDARLAAMRESRSLADASMPPRVDVEALIERWRNNRPDITIFTRREIRALCWDSNMAADTVFINAISSIPTFARNSRFLRGLWYAHERQWRLGTSVQIERMLAERRMFDGIAPTWLRELWQCKGALTTSAPSALAARAQSDWSNARKMLERMCITPDGVLGTVTLQEMVKLWTEETYSLRSVPQVADVFDAGYERLIADPRLPLALLHKVVEKLVGAVDGAHTRYRDHISKWILSDTRLGHPARISTRGNWSGISQRTRQLAVQLFAQRDLGAFFEVLIGRHNDVQQRRRFWERYMTSPQLVNFAIASDFNDRQRLIAQLGRERAQVAKLEFSPNDHSAFLMQFRGRADIVVAEMSKANNAMYLYSGETFEEHVGELHASTFTFHGLKNPLRMKDRLSHNEGWHWRFEQHLRSYGIFPGNPT